MASRIGNVTLAAICVAAINFAISSAQAAPPKQCKNFNVDVLASRSLERVTLPPSGRCVPRMRNGFPIPDRRCTPGAVNPTITVALMKTKGWTTKCIRNQATSATQKRKTYAWYNIPPPRNNTGKTMTCELDHVISLQLGGADTLDNLWPQCGPPRVQLKRRYFKQKDHVENYLAREIKAGRIALEDAQKGIATDWTQYIDAATAAGQR